MAKTVSKRKAAPGSQKLAGYLGLGCSVLLLNMATPTEHQPPTRPLLEPNHSMAMLGPRAGHANMCLNGILIMLPKEKSESISHFCVQHFETLWTVPRLLCPWDCPGQNTGGVAIPFSRGSSQPRDRTQVSCIAGRFFPAEPKKPMQEGHPDPPISLKAGNKPLL